MGGCGSKPKDIDDKAPDTLVIPGAVDATEAPVESNENGEEESKEEEAKVEVSEAKVEEDAPGAEKSKEVKEEEKPSEK